MSNILEKGQNQRLPGPGAGPGGAWPRFKSLGPGPGGARPRFKFFGPGPASHFLAPDFDVVHIALFFCFNFLF